MTVTERRVCRLSDLPAGRGWPVRVEGRMLAVFRVGSDLRVVDNACRHTGAPIDDGFVESGCVTCPWHGWRYDLATGEQITAFGRRRGLRTYPVREEDGYVMVDLPPDA